MKNEPLIRKEDTDTIIKNSYDNDAYLNSSFFSHLTFSWVYKIIKLAHITKLKSEYLGYLERNNKSKVFLKEIDDIWNRKGYKFRKTCPLFLAILHANICI